MNSSSTNVGGWISSIMRTYLNNDIYNALPSDLQSGIIDTDVVSGRNSTASKNYTSTDKLYLLSAKELFGKKGTSNVVTYDYAESETRQLDYYEINNVSTSNYSGAVKKIKTSTGTMSETWWLRTAYGGNTNNFYDVYIYSPWGVIQHLIVAVFLQLFGLDNKNIN